MLTLIASKKNAAQVSLPALQAAFSAALIAAGIQRDMAASLKLSDDKGIQKLNATYLGNDSPTDVLSFENAYIDPETGQEYLGDIVISLETAGRQALAHQAELQQELEMLLVHGTLHLLGFDHGDPASLDAMHDAQDAALTAIGNPLLNSIAPLD